MSDTAKAKDAREAIAFWREARPVQVVSMGGFGDDYKRWIWHERWIWEIAFAALEAMLDNPPEGGWQSFDGFDGKWMCYRDMIEANPVVAQAIDEVGPSTAMLVGAIDAAAFIAENGYQEELAKAPADRIIEVQRQSKWQPAAEGPRFR